MLDENDSTPTTSEAAADPAAPQAQPPETQLPETHLPEAQPREAQSDPAGPPVVEDPPPVKRAPRKATRKVGARTTRKAAAPPEEPAAQVAEETAGQSDETPAAQVAEQTAGQTDETPAAQVAEQVGAPLADAATADEASDARPAKKVTAKRAAAKKATAKKAVAKKATTKRAGKKASAGPAAGPAAAPATGPATGDEPAGQAEVPAQDSLDPFAPASLEDAVAESSAPTDSVGTAAEPTDGDDRDDRPAASSVPVAAPSLLFKAPDALAAPPRRARKAATRPATADEQGDAVDRVEQDEPATDPATPEPDETGALTDDGEPGGSDEPDDSGEPGDAVDSGDSDDEQGGNRRRRRRGGRRRRRGGGGDGPDGGDEDAEDGSTADPGPAATEEESGQEPAPGGRQGGRSGQRAGQKSGGRNAAKQSGPGEDEGDGQPGSGPDRAGEQDDSDSQDESTGSRRRRRRRRTGEEGDGGSDEPNTVVRVRKPRTAEDEITSLHGSTRLEAKKQRRREGREAGRRRAPIVSEAEFLARREAVDRVMVIRQRADLTQIAVLEDQVLVEHYVARESQTSLIGNVYLGRVQNVLPSMEAAFIDIGKGRNAVLYAGEVNWDSLGAGNGPRKIEQVLKSGQPILVQVSKDPIGHKGARLTSQISLPGRFLVYVPDGTTSGISRKLPDTERSRLKTLLKEIVPDSAGVIVRTAAEGASEEELTLDVERLTARWSDIESKVAKGNAPQLLYGEPDLTLKVVRDLFTEDFATLVISGDEAWDLVDGYVKHVAPDLSERLERYAGEEDVFAAYRIDEQIAKGLDRKVWLPSGGSLVIDRTEAMTVVDVNTGKFTGSGGNLEETVTKNNLEAAEEMVRQLRLRDIGGIIVVDFIDMVLESNRDLVLRRLVECLGRDRTRHQVAEVTSLGLVQMTRKRIGTGLVESFSENCDHCQGRGVVISQEPVEPRRTPDEEPRRGRRGRGRGAEGDERGAVANGSGGQGGHGGQGGQGGQGRGNGSVVKATPSPRDIAAMAKHEPRPVDGPATDAPVGQTPLAEPPADPAPPDPTAGAVPPAPTSDAASPDHVAVASVPVDAGAVPRSAHDGVPVDGSQHATPSEVSTSPTAPETAVPAVTPPESQPHVQPVPAGPRLVTSTRRRVARRPAGPPSGGTAPLDDHSRASDSSDEGGVGVRVGGAGADDPGAELVDAGRGQGEQAHVPVKKKGHRR